MVLVLITFVVLGIGMVFVIYGTIAKTKWGINVNPVLCPRCRTPLPTVRRPLNTRQALWGGYTCAGCGTEVDKWGREV
jgi:hypothetical protein